MSKYDHTKKTRDIAPEIMRGNPDITGELADSLEFKHKYRSAVFSFHPKDKPTDKQLNELLNKFEKIAFAGLEPDQYNFTAVLHREKNSEHIHIIVPRVELFSGKSMNIAPPGWKNTFDPLRDLFNEKYNWISPDITFNPDIARITQPGVEGTYKSQKAKARAEIKETIENALITEIEAGNITNREDLVLSLISMGLEVPRQGKDYVTILDTETDTRIRLKGAIYAESWTIEQSLENSSRREKSGTRENSESRVRELETELANRVQERIEYNQSRYPGSDQRPKPKPTRRQKINGEDKKRITHDMDKTNTDSNNDLSQHLFEYLGNNAISFSPHPEPVISNRSEQGNNRKNGSSEIKKMWNSREKQVVRADRRESTAFLEWLQSVKNKIKENHDRARREINESFRAFIKSIRKGYEAATGTSNSINEASKLLERSIQTSERTIERGVGKVRENRISELEKFKTNINLVEYSASQGYELIKRESSKNSKSLKHPGGDKIIVATDQDGYGIYFNVNDNSDQGSIIDFIQNRQNLNLGQVRKELRSFGGFTGIQNYKNYSKPLKSSKDTAQAAYVLSQAKVTDEHPYAVSPGRDDSLQKAQGNLPIRSAR